MTLSKKFLEEEIKKCKIAIETLENGLALHNLMEQAFVRELANETFLD